MNNHIPILLNLKRFLIYILTIQEIAEISENEILNFIIEINHSLIEWIATTWKTADRVLEAAV